MFCDATRHEHPSPTSEWYASTVISRQQQKSASKYLHNLCPVDLLPQHSTQHMAFKKWRSSGHIALS